jgi:putative ABC transport system substrate-binding protein
MLVRGTARAAETKRVAIFTTARSAEERRVLEERFGRVMSDFGFRLGRNLAFVWFEMGPEDRSTAAMERIARAIAASGVDCAITFGSPATAALRAATRTIPVVTDVGDPVSTGFAASIARPGGNITGLHQGFEQTALKKIELLRRLVPGLGCIVWVGARPQLAWIDSFERAARSAVMPVHRVVAESMQGEPGRTVIDGEGLRAAFRSLPAACRAAHLYSPGENLVRAVAELALERRIAVAHAGGDGSHVRREGMLLSYEGAWSDDERHDRRAAIVGRILRGEDPARIPFEGPFRYRFTLNLATARRIGVAVPNDVLVLADEVIGTR